MEPQLTAQAEPVIVMRLVTYATTSTPHTGTGGQWRRKPKLADRTETARGSAINFPEPLPNTYNTSGKPSSRPNNPHTDIMEK